MSSDIASEAAPAGLSGHAFSSLFQAITGLRNRRALVAMLGCMFVGVIVGGLLVAMTGSLGVFAGLLATVVWIVAIGTGVNAAGLLQMDHARGISPRSHVPIGTLNACLRRQAISAGSVPAIARRSTYFSFSRFIFTRGGMRAAYSTTW